MLQTVKTETISSSSYIKLKVQSQNNRDQYFTIRRNEALQTVLIGYCKLEGIEFDTTRFIFENNRVQPWDTPEKLEMEEEDVIDAFEEMLGGGALLSIPFEVSFPTLRWPARRSAPNLV